MKTATVKNPVVIGDLMKMALEHLNNLKNGEQKPQKDQVSCNNDKAMRIGIGKNDIHKFLNAA